MLETNLSLWFLSVYYGPKEKSMSSQRYKLALAPIKDTAQLTHLRSLNRVFDGCSVHSQGSDIVSEGKLKSWLYTHANLYLILDTGSFVYRIKTITVTQIWKT